MNQDLAPMHPFTLRFITSQLTTTKHSIWTIQAGTTSNEEQKIISNYFSSKVIS
ncbi:hypothetical protein COOONC_17619 [Cooperia oncophora]